MAKKRQYMYRVGQFVKVNKKARGQHHCIDQALDGHAPNKFEVTASDGISTRIMIPSGNWYIHNTNIEPIIKPLIVLMSLTKNDSKPHLVRVEERSSDETKRKDNPIGTIGSV